MAEKGTECKVSAKRRTAVEFLLSYSHHIIRNSGIVYNGVKRRDCRNGRRYFLFRVSIPIVVPCHRIIGKNTALTGFRGGLQVKEQLLHLEGIIAF
ncbi:MGMT family protein [Paenibacillus sp. MSJ-34]|nr:MGMT family protein [Paenibacillus sp. MSJ-34]